MCRIFEEEQMREHRERIALVILISLAAVIILMLGILAFMRYSGNEDEEDTQNTETDTEDAVLEKWQEGLVSYNGKHYKYNSDLSIYLFLGIDKEGVVETAEDYISGGQSDAIFLLVADPEEEELSLVSINRNTITGIETYDEDGNYLGNYSGQLCLQHGYGDGKEYSCTLSVNTVSELFYNLPIDGYMAINMGGIPYLNDSIGGVTLEVIQDLSYPDAGVELVAGETVTLTGTEAYYYLRGRDTNEFDSATYRLRRQEQYLGCFFDQLHEKVGSSASAMLQIYNSISDYLVTNIDVVDILDELAGYEYDDSRLYTVPGETVMGGTFEKFYIDEDAFYELCLEVFYDEVEE